MSLHRFNLIALFALAGCVGAPPSPAPPREQSVPPLPVPAAPSPPQPASETSWIDRALTPGTWVWKSDARGAVAFYGPVGMDAVLAIRCNRGARRIYISRPAASGSQITLRATTGIRAYPARPTGGMPPYVVADLAADDPQLDTIAFSRGRFMVSLAGAPDVIAPSWPEAARLIEECR